MFNKAALALDLAKAISQAIPEKAGQLPEGFKEKLRTILETKLQELDLVSRQDYQNLENRLKKLEEKCAQLLETQNTD